MITFGATPGATLDAVVNRGTGCQHAEIGDTVFSERATRPITRSNFDDPDLYCGDCRSYLYPHENGEGEVDVLDEPYGAGL